jgi:hypothetical protein
MLRLREKQRQADGLNGPQASPYRRVAKSSIIGAFGVPQKHRKTIVLQGMV